MLRTQEQERREHDGDEASERSDWWRDAVIYQVYPRSFSDANGDGIGDLAGVAARLGHIRDLGVDAVWLSPFYVSPQADAGYDVADYCDVDPAFGTLADFDALLHAVHGAGMRLIVDLVPNHTSSEHPWFRAALDAPSGSRERRRYIVRRGRGTSGELPPNDWTSVFGGPAWSPIGAEGEWYLHLFDAGQPDLDWTNPDVVAEFDRILRFWLDRGVDGFRVDVAHGLIKADGLPDWGRESGEIIDGGARGPMWDQEGVHEIYRRWRRVVAEYGPDRILVAEAWVAPAERLSRYVRPDEMHQAFNFDFLTVGWSAERMRRSIATALRENDRVGATTTWVLSNHDVVRVATRLGLADTDSWPPSAQPGEVPDDALGRRRARAAALVMLALPGSAYVYAGEELGLPDHLTLPDAARQDPTFRRTGGAESGRDGCRVPLPWEAAAPAFGFSATGASWLPQPEAFRELAANRQAADPDSTLALYRRCIALRRELGLGSGEVEWPARDGVAEDGSAEGVLAFRNRGVRVTANLGDRPHRVGEWPNTVASSPDAVRDGYLQPGGAVWQW